MIQTDEEYFQSRIALERQFAGEASTAEIAAMHEAIARGYEVLVQLEQPKRLEPSMTLPRLRSDESFTRQGRLKLPVGSRP